MTDTVRVLPGSYQHCERLIPPWADIPAIALGRRESVGNCRFVYG